MRLNEKKGICDFSQEKTEKKPQKLKEKKSISFLNKYRTSKLGGIDYMISFCEIIHLYVDLEKMWKFSSKTLKARKLENQ